MPDIMNVIPGLQHTAPRREIGLFSLAMIGVSSIIGSGWLFAAYHAPG